MTNEKKSKRKRKAGTGRETVAFDSCRRKEGTSWGISLGLFTSIIVSTLGQLTNLESLDQDLYLRHRPFPFQACNIFYCLFPAFMTCHSSPFRFLWFATHPATFPVLSILKPHTHTHSHTCQLMVWECESFDILGNFLLLENCFLCTTLRKKKNWFLVFMALSFWQDGSIAWLLLANLICYPSMCVPVLAAGCCLFEKYWIFCKIKRIKDNIFCRVCGNRSKPSNDRGEGSPESGKLSLLSFFSPRVLACPFCG